LYVSGQAAVVPATHKIVEGDVTAQAQQTFDNLEAVLRDAGLTMGHVVKCTVYLTAMSDFAAMNAVYQARFKPPYPARTTVAVALCVA
jgi:2-iminobutanoate/2-iminopropanoate deaminase